MFRYVVAVWCAPNQEHAHAAQLIASRLRAAQWQESMHAEGMQVFQIGVRPGGLTTQVLPDRAGVVIGRTFVRSSDVLDETPAPQWTSNPDETREIVASRGRWLIEHCWGNYVAVLRSSDPNRLSIVKDPTGTLPCFVTTTSGVTLIFSFADDLVRLGLCRFTINPAYLRAHVLLGTDSSLRPLNEVDQVRRGECAEVDVVAARLGSREFFWRPQPFIDSDDTFEDSDLAAKAMRAVVRMSTHTWAACETNIVHRLSGGLDSSIIAGCLKDAPNRPNVCCYTYFTPGAPSDERPWARQVATHLNFEHREMPVTWQDIDLRRAADMPLLVEPATILMFTLRSTIEKAVAVDSNASIVFNGDGGDSAFGAEAARYAASEFVRRHGWRLHLLSIAAQVALQTRQSTWGVLRGAIGGKLRGALVDPMEVIRPELSRLCSRDALADSVPGGMFVHPWFADEPHFPWSTVRRLGGLIASPQFYDASTDESVPEVISPLYSQPVTETLLRIPLYRLFEDGRDRGLARSVFAREVPAQILNRLWKDRAPGFHEQLIFRNRAFLRETFLDGVLSREGLLEPTAIEQAFSECSSKTQVLPAEVMRQFDLEVWARAWSSTSLQRPQTNLELTAH